jgi:hypothetical protein
VRNSWVTQDRESAGFWDAAAWEEVKKKDTSAIEKWIDVQMEGTSVTVVLMGAQTSERQHVGYEIKQSYKKSKGMLGIYIHNMKDANGKTDTKGNNPFAKWQIAQGGRNVLLSEIYPTTTGSLTTGALTTVETKWAIGSRRRQKKSAGNILPNEDRHAILW